MPSEAISLHLARREDVPTPAAFLVGRACAGVRCGQAPPPNLLAEVWADFELTRQRAMDPGLSVYEVQLKVQRSLGGFAAYERLSERDEWGQH